jgi:hypothetical protein
MKKLRVLIALILLISVCALTFGQREKVALAQETTPTRKTTLLVDYDVYTWWMIRYSDNKVMCEIPVEHEGDPIGAELLYSCGNSIFTLWKATIPCPYNANELYKCPGFYLYLAGKGHGQREVEVDLPLPEVVITLEGCALQQPQNTCNSLPYLKLTGEEPLPNEEIIRINGFLDGESFSCAGNQCILPLFQTGTQGTTMEFWADSSFGDSSQHFTAMVRVAPWGDFMDPDSQSTDPELWYVDVLSSQWRDTAPASCSDIWQVFPQIGGPQPWLTTPVDANGLATSISFYKLAAMLIRSGAVDAGSCQDGGLVDSSTASECGLQKALPMVLAWQNQFDTEILSVARNTGMPAQLIKNIFGRESQFWPGIYQNFMEAGLGQMTENGADTVLLWNPTFYDQFCPLILEQTICDLGFGNLTVDQQNMLRGGLVNQVNSACTDCPLGLDMSQANFSVTVFAETLLSNCEQVERIIFNSTSQKAGNLTSYEDLWRFTLVNYNAGAGCLSDAVQKSLLMGESLNWENIKSNLGIACQGAIDYVNDISQLPHPIPTATPWLAQTPRVYPPTPTAFPPGPTQTPTPPENLNY